jgi:glycosyltransferase involved in cell wall biosynthesis
MDRKGTAKLIEAWAECLWRGWIKKCQLDIVLSAPHEYAAEAIERCSVGRFSTKVLADSIRILPRMNLDEKTMGAFYLSYDLVCQPSRAEGFGLVPLEALACGVPVAATLCTGHDDFLGSGMPGVMPIAVREDRLSDDGPGAMAPEVYAEDIAWALGRAFASRDKLCTYAQQNADAVRSEWSWEASTRRFLLNTGREVG